MSALMRPASEYSLKELAMLRQATIGEPSERQAEWMRALPLAFLAEVDGETVGWCCAHPVKDMTTPHPCFVDAWIVGGVGVLPAWRRQGIGRELLSYTCTRAFADPDIERIVSVANARNEASLALHRQVGFCDLARLPAFAGIAFDGGEGVLMALDASSA